MNDSSLEERLLIEFRQEIEEEALARRAELDQETPLLEATALAEVMLGYLEEAGAFTEHDLCPHQDAGGRRPCRVIGFSLPEDSFRLDLFTCADPGQTKLSNNELAKIVGGAARFFDYAAKRELSRFADNPAALEAAQRIHSELGRIEEVRVCVLTDAAVRDRSVVDDIEVSGKRVTTDVWDLERLYRLRGEEVTRERIQIDFVKLLGRPLSCLEMKPPPKEYQTFLAILPGELIYRLFEEYGARLFEFNVRSFLQAKGAVNKGLQKTLREEPGRFLAYNNGLTATADEVDVGHLNGETVVRSIRGLQIVNGAQTTASIHRARKIDKLAVDSVAVSMKLTIVPEQKLQEFVPLIARFANTQNPIQLADLSASDHFQQQFEKLSETVWCPGEHSRWFYERARGSYQMARNREGTTKSNRKAFDIQTPSNQHFGKTDLAKYLMTWWGLPHVVSRGSQKNYAAFMAAIRERFGEEWTPNKDFYREAIAQAILFKTTQSVVRKAKLQSYGANVVTYLVAMISHQLGQRLSLSQIWESQEVSEELKGLLANWAPKVHAEIVNSAGNRNVTEWCKKEDCWNELQALHLSIPDAVPPELSALPVLEEDGSGVEGALDNPTQACMDLSPSDWLKVLTWATESPLVDPFDKRVIHTISGYAITNWERAPSPKQAARGARVIETARKEGVLS